MWANSRETIKTKAAHVENKKPIPHFPNNQQKWKRFPKWASKRHAECVLLSSMYKTIAYKFYCQLPVGLLKDNNTLVVLIIIIEIIKKEKNT